MIQGKKTIFAVPSRFSFINNVRELVENNQAFSLLFLDVIRFSDINRYYGYSAGDQVLAEITQRLLTIQKEKCFIGKVSDDVFGIVIKGNLSEFQVKQFSQQITQMFTSPVTINDQSIVIDFKIAAARYPQNSADFEQLFSIIESTLLKIKRTRYEKFSLAPLSAKHLDNGKAITLQSDLRRALLDNELELYLQPKVALNDNYKISGAECLLRWNHPIDGLLIPSPIIETAETYHMMDSLGNWILKSGFWSALNLVMAGCKTDIAINVSPTQLYDNNLIANLKRFSDETSVPLSSIELELTENIILVNSLLISERIKQLKDLGLKISIDDFGTGYSNLAYIRNLPVDTIKIDKIFIDEINNHMVNQAIVGAIVQIANAMNATVVAEGIETMQQAETLKKLGVDYGQGFLFSRPMDLDGFIHLMLDEKYAQKQA